MTRFVHVLLLALILLVSGPVRAQGCAQCRDNAGGTPPVTQRAYRHAIILLTVAASGFFLATATMLRRNR